MRTRTSKTWAGLAFAAGLPLLGSGCGQTVPPGSDCSDADATTPDTVPDFEAASFSDPTVIDNTYFPLSVGTAWTYSAATEDGTERTVVEVLADTRVVMGITTRVVRD